MTYLPILTYHRILEGEATRERDPQRISVSQEQFRRHLVWLKRMGYRTIALNDYVAELRRGGHRVGRKTIAITFDDGYKEVFTLGLPILLEMGFTATLFAVPAEETNHWDDGHAALMSADDYRQWEKAGMEIGAHSLHHRHLTQVDAAVARQELQDSKNRLEEMLGHPVPLFAYPYGETNDAVDALARDAGYAAAFATDRAPADHSVNLFRLRRTVVFPRNTPWEILWKVQRWYPAYQDFKR